MAPRGNHDAPRGSARERLKAFERDQSRKKGFLVKIGIMGALLSVVLIAQCIIGSNAGDRHWGRVPERMVRDFNKQDLDALYEFFAPGYVIAVDGRELPKVGRRVVLEELRQRAVAGSAYLSGVTASGDTSDGHWISRFLIYARGDLEDELTVPITKTWHMRMEVVDDGGEWRAKRLELRRVFDD